MGKFRKHIDVPGLIHRAPSPMGVRIGNMIFSGGIYGCNTETQEVPKNDPDLQAKYLFENVKKFMETAGASIDHIAHVKVFVKEDSLREYINKYWVELFPDKDDRPCRHAQVMEMRGDMLMQVELIAVIPE